MSEKFTISIDGQSVEVPKGQTVAAAILNRGDSQFRRSQTGGFRGPVCGMGICFECRVTINGSSHQRSCNRVCEDGMTVDTAVDTAAFGEDNS